MRHVAHPFRGEAFHCVDEIVPSQREPSGLKGLSYSFGCFLCQFVVC